MITVQDLKPLRQQILAWRKQDKVIGFVPTMGALHRGHLSLVQAAQAQCDHVVVSIFVNPLQFAFGEDFGRYPRQLEMDTLLLKEANTSLLYTPTAEIMYPENFSSKVIVTPDLTKKLCGATRQGHFEGVATVVTKLFNQVQPDKAFFGEKDYQQLLVIKKITADLDLPVHIIGVPTMREPDGLALSSRNQYLSSNDRKKASVLYQTLEEVKGALHNAKPHEYPAICENAVSKLLTAGFDKVDYVQILHVPSLNLIHDKAHLNAARIFAAAYLNKTRLIDNIAAG
jgi:pantoate--beta-alanine ligase